MTQYHIRTNCNYSRQAGFFRTYKFKTYKAAKLFWATIQQAMYIARQSVYLQYVSISNEEGKLSSLTIALWMLIMLMIGVACVIVFCANISPELWRAGYIN